MEKDCREFNGPPTPTRVVLVTERSGTDIYGEDTDIIPVDNGCSLAVLTGEVVEAQKYQQTELAGKHAHLHQLQVELETCKTAFDTVQNEFVGLNRRLYLLQDDVAQSEKECSQYQNNIMELLIKKRKLLSQLVDISWKDLRGDECYSKYRNKIKEFKDHVQDKHEQTELSKQIEKLKEVVKVDKKKFSDTKLEEDEMLLACKHLMKDTEEESLKWESVEIEITQLQDEVNKEKEHNFILEKEIDALYKRNTAQMTRLKRQLQESKNRTIHWHDDNQKLEERIHHLKKQWDI